MFWANHKLMSYRDFILDQYTEKNRLYHGLYHIAQMFQCHKQMTKNNQSYISGTNVDRIIYAILYHDIVYDAKAPCNQNEEQSAALWLKHFHDQEDESTVAVVHEMITATSGHLAQHQCDDLTSCFLDLDLCSLAAPYKEFELNNCLIRLEYSHVPDLDYHRADFLKALLKKPKIYRHQAFEFFEPIARYNIGKLLATYSATPNISSGLGLPITDNVQAY